MSNVYFKPVKSHSSPCEVSKISKEVLEELLKGEKLNLESQVPLKVHFGEKGNRTYVRPESFDGIIDLLEDRRIKSCFIETNALYRGQRTVKENHIKLAESHGFTRLPVVIADGERGEKFELVDIGKKHFKQCKIGKIIAESKQIIVLSHFKGHALAGFGGAVKQLAMGCAARGGKLDQHANSKPIIVPFMCRTCGTCSKNCPVDAITIKRTAKINKNKCIGCSSCQALCPYHAITSNWFKSLSASFNERLAEYALGSSINKKNIYINFAVNITAGCDCEGHKMMPVTGDIGIFGSTDPVAVDKACLDKLNLGVRLFFLRGVKTLNYGEKIGLGSMEYKLVTLE